VQNTQSQHISRGERALCRRYPTKSARSPTPSCSPGSRFNHLPEFVVNDESQMVIHSGDGACRCRGVRTAHLIASTRIFRLDAVSGNAPHIASTFRVKGAVSTMILQTARRPPLILRGETGSTADIPAGVIGKSTRPSPAWCERGPYGLVLPTGSCVLLCTARSVPPYRCPGCAPGRTIADARQERGTGRRR